MFFLCPERFLCIFIFVIFRAIEPTDFAGLSSYLQALSYETRSRFGPHSFEPDALRSICENRRSDLLAYVGVIGSEIVCYTIIKCGYLAHDVPRLAGYHLHMNLQTDYTVAPSVADEYQSKGIGSKFHRFLEGELTLRGAKKTRPLGRSATHQ